MLTTLSFARLPGNVPLADGISSLEVWLCVQTHGVPEFKTEMLYSKLCNQLCPLRSSGFSRADDQPHRQQQDLSLCLSKLESIAGGVYSWYTISWFSKNTFIISLNYLEFYWYFPEIRIGRRYLLRFFVEQYFQVFCMPIPTFKKMVAPNFEDKIHSVLGKEWGWVCLCVSIHTSQRRSASWGKLTAV